MNNDILVRIGANTADFARKMKESSKSLSDFGKKNQETFDSFKQTGALITGAGVALAGGLGYAVSKAMDFENGMSSVAAISGATGTELDLLTDTAREWGSATSFSATESAKALEYMAQ